MQLGFRRFICRNCLFLSILGISSFSFGANESPQTFTLDGQLFQKGTTQALSDSHAKLTLQILNPSQSCVLYEESQYVNTTTSDGRFTVQVGSNIGDPKRGSSDSAHSMNLIFQNISPISAIAVPGQTCAGNNYSPSAGDTRYLRLVVTPTSGADDVLSPDMALDSVPNALVAQSVQGLERANILQTTTNGSVNLTQAALEGLFTTPGSTNLQSILAGNFVASGATGVNLPTLASNPSATEGNVWYDSSTHRVMFHNGTAPVPVGLAPGTTWPSAAGSAGQVLQTNGSGVLSWAPASTNPLPAAAGTAAAPSYAFSGNTNTGMFGAATNQIGFATNGSERLRVDATGNVGIGTTSPLAPLDVNGIINVRGVAGIHYPTGDTTVGGSIAIGASALANQTAGGAAAYGNTAIGYQAMGTGTMTTAAKANAVLGFQAGKSLTSGNSNILAGYGAGSALTTGTSNVVLGSNLSFPGNGISGAASNNILIGGVFYAGSAAVNDNVMIGSPIGGRLYANTTIALGSEVLNGPGYPSTANVVAIGNGAMGYNVSGANSGDIAVGTGSLGGLTGSDYNIGIGFNGGNSITSGARNVALGPYVASTTLSTGSNNILIGTSASVDTPAASTSNFLNIGNTIFATGMTGTLAAPAGNVGVGTTSPAATLDVAGNVKLGSTGTVFTATGTCIAASTAYTAGTAVNFTCTGVPASTAVAVYCSPSAALAGYLTARATGTANQIAITSGVSATYVMTCMWMAP